MYTTLSISNSSSSNAEECINVLYAEQDNSRKASELAVALFSASYQLMTEKLKTLATELDNGKPLFKTLKTSCVYRTHEFLQEFHIPLACSSVFFFGVGLTSYIMTQNSSNFTLQEKIILPLASTALATLTPGILHLICKHQTAHIDQLKGDLLAKQQKLAVHELRADCAHAIALFDQAYQNFCKTPSEETLQAVLVAFSHIPLHPQIYPANLDPLAHTTSEAKSISLLFLIDHLLKVIPQDLSKAKESPGECSLIAFLEEFFATLENPPAEAPAWDVHWPKLSTKLNIEPPTPTAINYYLKQRKAVHGRCVAAEIVSLFKGVLNAHYLPQPPLQIPPLLMDVNTSTFMLD